MPTTADSAAAHAAKAVDLVVGAMSRHDVWHEVEFDCGTWAVAYHTEGRHWAATETDPAEYPQIVVTACRFQCGAADVEMPFDLLSESVQDDIYTSIREAL